MDQLAWHAGFMERARFDLLLTAALFGPLLSLSVVSSVRAALLDAPWPVLLSLGTLDALLGWFAVRLTWTFAGDFRRARACEDASQEPALQEELHV